MEQGSELAAVRLVAALAAGQSLAVKRIAVEQLAVAQPSAEQLPAEA